MDINKKGLRQTTKLHICVWFKVVMIVIVVTVQKKSHLTLQASQNIMLRRLRTVRFDIFSYRYHLEKNNLYCLKYWYQYKQNIQYWYLRFRINQHVAYRYQYCLQLIRWVCFNGPAWESLWWVGWGG